MRRRRAVALLVPWICLSLLEPTAAGAAAVDNACANSNLDAGTGGWGPLGDLATRRQAITDHPVARWELAVANGAADTAGIYLPELAVRPGAVWDVGADVRTAGDPARMRMEMDWYSDTAAYLGHTNGGYLPVSGRRDFTRISGRFTAPAQAARAHVLLRATDLAPGGGFAGTGCDYLANPAPDVTLSAVPGDGTATATWTTTRTDIIGWSVGRDDADTDAGPPPADRPAEARGERFDGLRNGAAYSVILVPRTATGPLTPVSVSVRPVAAQPPVDQDGAEAAVRYGWGAPLAQFSDEFDYVGPPRADKWGVAGECWDNPHADGGRRCASRTTVDGTSLVMTGLADGDTGWLQSEWSTRYGRWEARVRSRSIGAGNGRTYHPLLIVWPDGDRWPDEGEYDFLENQQPGAACAEAFLHYPHPASVPVQQEFVADRNCGAPLSEWHNVAFEWTPAHVRGYVDGRVWFTFSGGANSRRRAMQSMASGHLTVQLDNFDGTDMTPARYELDWVRVYPVR